MKRCALLCLLALWAVSAEAATYYVRTGGSDSHSCGQAQTDNNSNAKGSIQGGINCVQGPGDTLIVHGGHYGHGGVNCSGGGPGSGQRTCLRNHGNSGASITLRAATGETVWHDGYFSFEDGSQHGEWWLLDGINIDCHYQNLGAIGCLQTASNVKVQNLEVRNGHYIGILINPNNHFINVRSHGHGQQFGTLCNGGEAGGQCHGFYFHNTPQVIENSEAYDNHGWGIAAVYDDTGVGNVLIRNNKIHETRGGIQIIAQPSPFRVYNNVIYNSLGPGIWIGPINGAEVYNNTFYGNTGGIEGREDLPVRNSSFRNNIFYSTGQAINLPNQTGGGNSFSNNLCETSVSGCSSTGNPKFVNGPGGDFHLQPGSPAINTGMTVRGVTTDFDKTPRPQGGRFTIGAFEYADNAPRPLSAPTRPRRNK